MPIHLPRSIALVAALTALAAMALADSGPQAVLTRIYATYYMKDGGPGMPISEPALKSYMVPDLAHAWAVSSTKDPSEGIDFDPFVEGQDFKLTALKVGEPAMKGQCAEVVVTFRNMGQPTRLTYTLAQAGGGWRIADLAGPGHPALRKMLKLPAYGCGRT